MEGTNGGTPAAGEASSTVQDMPPTNGSAKAKVTLSLGKKKKKKTSTSNSTSKNSTSEHFAKSTTDLAAEQADDNKTIADRAHEVAQNRQDALVIPCVGGAGGGSGKRPLLAGRAQALQADSTSDAAVKKEEDTAQAAIKTEHTYTSTAIKSESIDDDAAACWRWTIRSWRWSLPRAVPRPSRGIPV